MPKLNHVLIAAHGINDIDDYGVQTIREITEWLKKKNYGISYSGFKDNVIDKLKDSLVYETIGSDSIYPTQLKAVASIYDSTHQNSDEQICPLTEVVPKKQS
jgi:hypothetical protein